MNQVFKTKKTLTFREADPAGIMFFGHIFALAHDAFEEFIVAAGYGYKEWFGINEHIIPIRHTEADYLAPFIPGETYDIAVQVAHIGNSSFKMKYHFSQNGRIHAVVSMVHAVVEFKTMKKAGVPSVLRSRLEPYQEGAHVGI